MYRGVKAAGLVFGGVLMAAVSIRAEAAPLDTGLSAGIAVNFDQITDTEEETRATAEVVWTGTPLEGYMNIGIANVEDNLNIRAEANTDSELVGKMRKDSACEILSMDGEWAHITSGEVEGYVKAEFLYTGQEAVDLAFELGELKTALTITEALYGEGVTDVRVSICEFAKQYVGNRYVWGGTSLTKGADCSGFTLAVYQNFGVSLPHSSRAQANCGTKISVSEVKPGDLIFYGNGRNINHVVMYIGNGQVVHASNARNGIMISDMYYRTPVSAARIIED